MQSTQVHSGYQAAHRMIAAAAAHEGEQRPCGVDHMAGVPLQLGVYLQWSPMGCTACHTIFVASNQHLVTAAGMHRFHWQARCEHVIHMLMHRAGFLVLLLRHTPHSWGAGAPL